MSRVVGLAESRNCRLLLENTAGAGNTIGRTFADKLSEVMDRFADTVGIRRLKSLHVNDSMTRLGSNRDRDAIPGEGKIGKRGCGAFLSEPRFEKLPALFEGRARAATPPDKVDVDTMRRLRANGLRARKRRA